ncbi:MAG: laccase domain-containing protein [Elusimicrobia bacterium]|nr:laccase domain-containing protein [Elusimicrobiota bacterium]
MWADERWTPEGLVGGVTSKALGDMNFDENRRKALARAGLGGFPAYFAKQVHGTGVVALERGRSPDPWPEADGWATREAGLCLGVFAADCMPLFVWRRGREGGSVIGLFHSGWRGTRAGMPREAAESFRSLYGVPGEALAASIGPHIGPCCYEVSSETARGFPAGAVSRREGKIFLDLGVAAALQLSEAGLDQSDIATSSACTSCGKDEFYSFRRDKQSSRMLAFFAISGAVS